MYYVYVLLHVVVVERHWLLRQRGEAGSPRSSVWRGLSLARHRAGIGLLGLTRLIATDCRTDRRTSFNLFFILRVARPADLKAFTRVIHERSNTREGGDCFRRSTVAAFFEQWSCSTSSHGPVTLFSFHVCGSSPPTHVFVRNCEHVVYSFRFSSAQDELWHGSRFFCC